MSDSKQMRVSAAQYDMLGDVAKNLGMKRAELLSNLITLAKLIDDNNTELVKLVDSEGKETSFVLPVLVRGK